MNAFYSRGLIGFVMAVGMLFTVPPCCYIYILNEEFSFRMLFWCAVEPVYIIPWTGEGGVGLFGT